MKQNIITCCFTGHRPKSLPCGYNEEHPACLKIKTQLRRMISGLIEKKNVTHFISGMAQGVDMWAAEIVLEYREEFPDIILEAAIPCKSQTSGWNVKYKDRYDHLLSLCDKVTILQKYYTHDCMMKRNRYMVDNSDYIVAVWNGNMSGTEKTIKYAVQQGKPVYCINSVNYKMIAI